MTGLYSAAMGYKHYPPDRELFGIIVILTMVLIAFVELRFQLEKFRARQRVAEQIVEWTVAHDLYLEERDDIHRQLAATKSTRFRHQDLRVWVTRVNKETDMNLPLPEIPEIPEIPEGPLHEF